MVNMFYSKLQGVVVRESFVKGEKKYSTATWLKHNEIEKNVRRVTAGRS